MGQFNYSESLARLMVPGILSALCSVHEHKGRQDLYLSAMPDVLGKLTDAAMAQSTGASNRLENISTSNKRLRDLMAQKSEPRNKDEREIAGYRYVLNMIHQSHDSIPITPGVILQLHRDLYRYHEMSFAGRWKDSDNVIAERNAEGEMVARFVPTSAARTPDAIQRICEEYAQGLADKTYDPMLLSLLFVFDFVSIHPFNDGNGRMSRLLTLLLTYRCGYTVGKYVSIEAEVEASKDTYYEALKASSEGWSEGKNDYVPFVTYMLGVMGACYRTLDERVGLLSSGGSNEEILRTYFANLLGEVTKRQVMDDNPVMSQRTVERILQNLQAEGLVDKIGAARATRYRRAR